MRILITGARGQVGSSVVEQFSSDERHKILALDRDELDIVSRDQVFSTVTQFQPQAIVNCAAMTNVDACEEKVDEAFAINALGVRNLSNASDEVGSQLIHISTDFVFDGEINRPYSEYDPTNPLSVYAKSKVGGDVEALSSNLGTVLRVAWVFGNLQGDFFTWVLDGIENGSITHLIDDQVSTPTYSYDVARVVEHVVKHRIKGLIHVANAGETTRLEMGKEVCKRLGINESLEGIPAEKLARPAARPAYSSLNTNVLKELTGIQLRTWQEALDEHIEKLREKK